MHQARRIARSLAIAVLLLPLARAGADWGPRIGLSSDPDQISGGLQWNVGEVAPNVRLMPSVELANGDDILRLAGNAGIHYLFGGNSGRWAPYAGGEVSFSYWDWDRPAGYRGDDSDTELGISIAGGVETRLRSGRVLNLELRFGLDNVPDVQLHVGWIF